MQVVNYATKWTSQKWSPHTPCPEAVADNLGVLSGRVPVLSGYPIIRGKHWYIGRETRGSGRGGGWQRMTRARWVAHRGRKKVAFHSHGVGVGVGVPWGGQPANGWRKNRDTEGNWGAHRRVHGRGGSIKHNWPLCCAGREAGTRLKRQRGVGTPGVTDEAILARQHTISPRLMTVQQNFMAHRRSNLIQGNPVARRSLCWGQQIQQHPSENSPNASWIGRSQR